ncbi:uncharacterized protein LOC135942178 [Cloeon dipterum]|uniref:uncharacterized protein LOC135942178 n=1 Tax=Cloeon dipterum TaxID=197152 RepID=UPI00321F9641
MDGATDIGNAENVFVLVIHYNKTRNDCKDCAADVHNLRKTLEEKRNYKLRVLSSPRKEDLFSLLSDQEKLLQYFNSEDHEPSVFVIFFLSYGCDDEGNNFILEDIYASLSNLKSFSNCLKVCVLNRFQNELNSLPSESIEDGHISNSPFELDSHTKSMKNFIAFCTTSVVLTANDEGNDGLGSTLVNAICEILDNLDISMELLQFLTLIQGKIRCEETNAVTPKIRVFSKTEKFIISPLPIRKDEAVSCLLANKSVKSLEHMHVNSNFHKREMSAGEAIRSRYWACIIYRKMSKQVRQLNEMILEKLNFNTMMDEWRNDILETYSGPEVDLVMACLFCFVDKQNENQEICLKIDHQEQSIPIATITRQLVGGLHTKVIGKPKICILINQNVESSGTAPEKKMAIRVTNHSGWLVLVIDERHTEQLIHVLQGDTLQRGKSLHELIAPLLVKGSTDELDSAALLKSTVQYLIDSSSNKSTFFAKPSLTVKTVKDSGNSFKNNIGYNDLLKRVVKDAENRSAVVWLFSSIAGGGKSTVLQKMAYDLANQMKNIRIVQISLETTAPYFKLDCSPAEYLACATHHSTKEAKKLTESKKLIVFLDGYDEISSTARDRTLSLIEWLCEKKLMILVSARPREIRTIQNRLKTRLIHIVDIEPFNIFKQLDGMQRVLRKSKGDKKLFQNELRSIFMQSSQGSSLGRDECKTTDNLYLIYEQVVLEFVRKAVENRSDKEKAAQRILDGLILHAFNCITGHTKTQETTEKKDLESMKNTKIVKIDGERVTFLHQSFAEFLASKSFLDKIATSSDSDLALFKNWNFAPCRKFINLFYSSMKKDQLHECSKQLLSFLGKQPRYCLNTICEEDLGQIFAMLEPHISFVGDSGLFYVADCEQLVIDSVGSEDIVMRLLQRAPIINRICRLSVEKLIELLDRVARYNAIAVLKRLKEIFEKSSQSLPDMIQSQNENIDAGITATENGHYQILDLLLKSGVDVNITLMSRLSGRKTNALHTACTRGDINCFKILLEHNVDLEQFSAEDRKMFGTQPDNITEGSNIVHFAAYVGLKDMVSILHHHNAALIHTESTYGFSPLHFAAWKQNWELCLWLAEEAGIDVEILDPRRRSQNCFEGCSSEKWTMFDWRAQDFMLLLCAKISFNKGDSKKLNLIADRKLKGGQTLLHAMQEDNKEMCTFLIDKNCGRVQDMDDKGRTALHLACKKHFKRVCAVLLKKGANVNSVDCKGRTTLHYAAKYGESSIAKLLIENGGDVKQHDYFGRSALHYGNIILALANEEDQLPSCDAIQLQPVIPSSKKILCFNIAFHRLFTYPPIFNLKYGLDLEMFVEAGFYYVKEEKQLNPILRCFSCDFEIEMKDFQAWRNMDVKSILKMKGNDCEIGVSNTENVPMKSYHVPNFKYEAARLFSLLQKKNWSYVTPLDLAKNGFYYSGDDDNCRCAFCNLEVRGWEAGDTARGEHKRWNPNCLFLRNIQNIDNVIIGQEAAVAKKPGYLKGISDPFLTTESLSECLGSHLLQKETSSTNTTVRNLNLMLWSTSKHPNFASLLKRTETFKNYWPLSMAQTGHELARAGFYYTGSGDMVICFHCGIGLKDWDREDDPFKQHAKWSSACQFLLLCKGSRSIKNVLFATKAISDKQPTVVEILNSRPGEASMRCKLCQNNCVKVANLPCGHINVCERCGGDECLTCARPIEGTIEIFY